MKKLLGMILTLALAAGLAWPVYAESSTVPPEVTVISPRRIFLRTRKNISSALPTFCGQTLCGTV